MGMVPVDSNVKSKTCDEPISSNCIVWAGPAVNNVCAGASITDIVTSVAESSQCCTGDFPVGHKSCYTGTWVTFTPTIGGSGSSGSCSWVTDTSITNFGPPQYKWTKEGDLKVRGGFRLIVTPGANVGVGQVPLVTLPVSCFPTGATSPQFNITAVDPLSSGPNGAVVLAGGIALNPLTGVMTFGFSFSNILLTTITSDISLGGTTLNLA